VKLTWLREQFIVPLITDVEAQQHACAYIFHMIGTQLFPDYSKNKVYLRWLPLLEDFDICGAMSWGSAILAYLYRSLYSVSMMQSFLFSEHSELLQVLRIFYYYMLYTIYNMYKIDLTPAYIVQQDIVLGETPCWSANPT